MKLIKLLLASLFIVGALQAHEFKHHNSRDFALGMVSGIVVLNAIAQKHHLQPVYIVHNKRHYHKRHFSHRKHDCYRDNHRHKRNRDHREHRRR